MSYMKVLAGSSLGVNCRSLLFVDRLMAVLRIEISSKKHWEWVGKVYDSLKKDFLKLICFSVGRCVAPTCAETGFIHCVGGYIRLSY